MDRRGFLKRMSAAAAAFAAAASGRAAAAGPSTPLRSVDKAKPIARPLPGVSITADTSKFEKAIGEAGAEVVRLLRKCRVVESNWERSVHQAPRYRAVFEQASSRQKMSDQDTEAWRVIESGCLTHISVSTDCGGRGSVIAEWIVPG